MEILLTINQAEKSNQNLNQMSVLKFCQNLIMNGPIGMLQNNLK